MRWFVDKIKGSKDEADTSPGVLLSSGYIAGGSIAGVTIAFMSFAPKFTKSLDLHTKLSQGWQNSNWPSLVAFGVLMFVMAMAGLEILFKAAKLQRRPSDK